MNLENLDDKTSIEKDLGYIVNQYSDTLFCKFRYSPQIGPRFHMVLAPDGRGATRSCSLPIDDFKGFIDILKLAATLFEQAGQMDQKRKDEAKAIEEAIKRLTE